MYVQTQTHDWQGNLLKAALIGILLASFGIGLLTPQVSHAITYNELTAPGSGWTWNSATNRFEHTDGRTAACTTIVTSITSVIQTCTVTNTDGQQQTSEQVQTQNADGTATNVGTGSTYQGNPLDALVNGIQGLADWMFGISLQLISVIVAFIMNILVWIFLGILTFVALIFNFVVNEFVIGMGRYVTAPDAEAVRTAWVMFRDIANIGIIAGLIATAIGTIIGNGQYNISQNLARLILAALLVNFSYFFAGAIIDASNFVAKAAYETVIYNEGCESQPFGCGIAARFARATDLGAWASTVFTDSADTGSNAALDVTFNDTTQESGRNSSASKSAIYSLMLLIFVGVTIFVFLSAISLLVARFVALIFLLVTSPIGIAGGAVPVLKEYAQKWWKALWGQTMFAPVYFLLLGLSMNMLDQFHGAIFSGGGLADPLNNNGVPGSLLDDLVLGGGTFSTQVEAIIGVTAVFVVAIGFMWVALTTARSMSNSEWFKPIYDASGKALGWIPKAYTFGIGMGVRETIGKGAYYGAIAYRKFAGERRFDKSKIPGVAALDRFAKKQLDKVADQKFFGAEGYHKVHEEVKARGVELGEVEREQEQDGLATGKLTSKQKKKYQDYQKKRASQKGLNDAQEAELKDLEERLARGEKLSDEELATLNDLRERKERGGLDAKEWAEFKDLDSVAKNGGFLHQLEHAQKEVEKQLQEGGRKAVNEQARLADLQLKKTRGETLSEQEKAELAYYELRHREASRVAALGGADKIDERIKTLRDKQQRAITSGDRTQGLTPEELKELRDLRQMREAGRNGEALRNKEGLESKGAFEARQRGRGKWGKQLGEDDTAYFERIEQETGFRPTLAKLQAIEAQLPGGFLERKYNEHPEHLVEYAQMLSGDEFVKIMQDPKIRRDIKNQMREKRNGWYMNRIRQIEEMRAKGLVLEGTDEWNELLAVPYYYNMKRMPNREEFKDMVLSETGEDLRNIDFFWNGGSLTGMYLGVKESLGAYEKRAVNTMKREAYYRHQRSLTGAYMLEGMDDIYNTDGTLKDSYHIPNVGGSDRYSAAKEAWKDAKAKIAAANKVIEAGIASPETIAAARDQLRYYQMVAATEERNFESVFTKIKDKDQRMVAVRQAQTEVADIWEESRQRIEAGMSESESQAIAMAKIRGDERLFIVHHQNLAEQGMIGFMEGKNSSEELALVSMERTYSPATVIGKSTGEIMQMMNGYDIRFKRAIRRAFMVEKEDSEIITMATNDNTIQAFGDYPPREEIDEINKLRRQKYGLLLGDIDPTTGEMITEETHPEIQHRVLPYEPLKLGESPKKAARHGGTAQTGGASDNSGNDADGDADDEA